jgi:hypothetical protein
MDAPGRQKRNKGPRRLMAAISTEGEDNHEWHWRVELRTAKQRNTLQDPQEDPI